MKLLTRFEHLYNVSTRGGIRSCQHSRLPTAQKVTPYQALLFNQLWDLLHQWQLNLGNIFETKDRCALTKLKLPSDFTVTCLLLSIAAIPFIQLWLRGGRCTTGRGELDKKGCWCSASIEPWSSLPLCFEFCPNKISHPTEMVLLWIKECLKEGNDKTGWLELKHQ